MNRRGFLQLLAAAPASILIPVPKFVLAEPEIILPSNPIFLGTIRAITEYDFRMDRWIVRLDALNKTLNHQLGIDFALSGYGDVRKNYLLTRKFAEEHLRQRIIEEKWVSTDMTAIPIPLGYIEPEWMRS